MTPVKNCYGMTIWWWQ